MYTEENEFDYEDYGNNNQNKGFINGSLITKIILIVILWYNIAVLEGLLCIVILKVK